MRNHGNWVMSLSRWRGGCPRAEELGVMVLPETDRQKVLLERGQVVGVLIGDRGRGRDGEPLAAFEPGAEVRAQVSVLAEGTAGICPGWSATTTAWIAGRPRSGRWG